MFREFNYYEHSMPTDSTTDRVRWMEGFAPHMTFLDSLSANFGPMTLWPLDHLEQAVEALSRLGVKMTYSIQAHPGQHSIPLVIRGRYEE